MGRRLIVAAAAVCLWSCANAQQWAVVNTSTLNLRAAADYESGLESQCLMGTVLRVGEQDRYWRRVSAPDYDNVWATELDMAFMTEDELKVYEAAPKYICTAEYSHIFAGPDPDSGRLYDFIMGNIVRVGTEAPAGGRVSVLTASGERGWVPSSDVVNYGEWLASRRLTERNLVDFSRRFLGIPYLWGGVSVKGFDCSGFVGFVYRMNGKTLPRNAREQVNTGIEIPFDFSVMRPGDLCFFGTPASGNRAMRITHVGMYIGDGRMIHSSQLVRINSLRESDPDYYGRIPVAVRRVL